MIRRPGRATPPYQLFSVLLRYPDERLITGRDELLAAIDALPAPPVRAALTRFGEHLAGTTATELARHHVEVFDLDKRCCPYLTYYVHGDTRRRGAALLDLRQRYAAAGLQEAGSELPDYLPLMLEFAALAPEAGPAALQEYRPALELLHTGVHRSGSPYRHVLDGLSAALPRPTAEQRNAARQLTDRQLPVEQVGIEILPAMRPPAAPATPVQGSPS